MAVVDACFWVPFAEQSPLHSVSQPPLFSMHQWEDQSHRASTAERAAVFAVVGGKTTNPFPLLALLIPCLWAQVPGVCFLPPAAALGEQQPVPGVPHNLRLPHSGDLQAARLHIQRAIPRQRARQSRLGAHTSHRR